jgi:hypothetical protein
MKDFQEYFLRPLKKQLHKNVPRKTIEAAAAQECPKKNN